MNMESKYILPPEWAEHSAILLTWPHAGTDWREYLEDICNVYVEMADAITRHERLIIATPELSLIHISEPTRPY